jgi:hypothetical protein
MLDANFVELRYGEVRRMLFLLASVNKGTIIATIIRTIAPRDRLFSLCRLVRHSGRGYAGCLEW